MNSVPFTLGNPALIAKARAESIKFVGLAGRGATASGAVVIRELPHNKLHPFAVHFFNSQDGGYYFGDYCTDRRDAEKALESKLMRYDRDCELTRAFTRLEREAA